MRMTLLVVGTLVIATALLFGTRAAVRLVMSARRAFAEHRPLPASAIPNRLLRLLRRGRDGDFIVISDPRAERFVQFRRYVDEPGRVGLLFDFPRAPWSENYYQELVSRLEHDGTPFVLQPTLDLPVTEFVQVDCGRDLDLATRLFERVLFDIFGMPRHGLVRITNGQTRQGRRSTDRDTPTA